jgi:hypothetical protein
LHVSEPLLVARDSLACFVCCSHVEPSKGLSFVDTRCEITAGDLLLIGRDPRLEYVTDDALGASLEALRRDRGLRIVRHVVDARGPDSWVSRVQVAVWFEGGRLMAASVGRQDVEVQAWGRGRAQLNSWPGEALSQLSTLWLPLTEGSSGPNLRWRVALAYTGPDTLIAQAMKRRPAGGIPTGEPPAVRTLGRATGSGHARIIEFRVRQRNVVVERFKPWLDFPARYYDPKEGEIQEHREDEGADASRRKDTRRKRLHGVKDALAKSVGYWGGDGPDLLATLVHYGIFTPSDACAYPDEINLKFLIKLELLPRL